jgi:hypothetical protein
MEEDQSALKYFSHKISKDGQALELASSFSSQLSYISKDSDFHSERRKTKRDGRSIEATLDTSYMVLRGGGGQFLIQQIKRVFLLFLLNH